MGFVYGMQYLPNFLVMVIQSVIYFQLIETTPHDQDWKEGQFLGEF